MSFAAEWLALREPYDHAARNAHVLQSAAQFFAGQTAISVADLACGTGATLRALARHLPARQSWHLFDNDLGLLLRASAGEPPAGVRVATTPLDLAHDLEAALDGPVDLVTASALLDLVSAKWLDRLVTEIAARKLPFYAALSYDGRATMDPVDPLDAAIVAAVNRHQASDKGFGPALGPTAAAAAIEGFGRAGYRVAQGRSDWQFGPDDKAIQLEIVGGWAGAAREAADLSLLDVAAWLTRRRDVIADGRSRLTVGHRDFFAAPIVTR
jgi:Methyltransferase domain